MGEILTSSGHRNLKQVYYCFYVSISFKLCGESVYTLLCQDKLLLSRNATLPHKNNFVFGLLKNLNTTSTLYYMQLTWPIPTFTLSAISKISAE